MSLAPTLLLADIGGTNTRVALASGKDVRLDTIRVYKNKGRSHIDEILKAYLAETGNPALDGACVAAAGPVRHGAVTMTNVNDDQGRAWLINGPVITAATGTPRVAVLNDLQAQGHALGHIPARNLRAVVPGPDCPGEAKLVVGLGTGVNAAPVHPSGQVHVVPPSECGHVNMPVRTEEDFRLLRFIENLMAGRQEVPHAGVEEALSGRGLANLHAFAAAEMGGGPDLDSQGVLAALEAGNKAAAEAARLYVRILAQTLADLALIHLPYDGIYLIGGMSRAMTPHFAKFGLEAAFRERRRVPLLLSEFSIRVVEDDYAALQGCASYLMGQMGG